MAIADVLGYARTRMRLLGFEEWEDAFAFDNVPRSKFDAVFHLEFDGATKSVEHQDAIHISVPFTVRVLKRTFLGTNAGRDTAIALGDTIIDDFITNSRLENTGFESIFFDTMAVEPLGEDNDNSLVLILDFSALVWKCTR